MVHCRNLGGKNYFKNFFFLTSLTLTRAPVVDGDVSLPATVVSQQAAHVVVGASVGAALRAAVTQVGLVSALRLAEAAGRALSHPTCLARPASHALARRCRKQQRSELERPQPQRIVIISVRTGVINF